MPEVIVIPLPKLLRLGCAVAGTVIVGLSFSASAVADPKPQIKVDRFGQSAGVSFPRKIRSESDFKRDLASEQKYYAAQPSTTLDQYGGLPDSGKKYRLHRTGFFHVEHPIGSKTAPQWVMVDPAGNAYFQLGICEFGVGDDYTLVGGREQEYEWLPQANGTYASAFNPAMGSSVFSFYVGNLIRKYGVPFDSDSFASRMIARVKAFGFNSGGPFSGATPAFRKANFSHVYILNLSDGITPIPGVGGIFDPFDRANADSVQRNFARDLPGAANDPLLVGYFLANEPLLEDLPRVIPTLDSKHPCKLQFVSFLQHRYGTVAELNTAWKLNVSDFGALSDMSLSPATASASKDVQDFMVIFLDRYYRIVTDTFHKYDSHHMLLGNRFQFGTINNEQLCRIAGKYMDVMSFNYYTNGLDLAFLKRIYGWTGRPILLSEYFFDSPAESGLSGGILDMKTQRDRGLAYRDYVEHAASLGFVVGTEWFTLVDQAASGRWFQKYDGERANSGLFSVGDEPWKDMVAEAGKTNRSIYDVEFAKRPAFSFNDPRFRQNGALNQTLLIPHANGTVLMDGTSAGFPGIPASTIPGTRLVQGSDSNGFEANFKACYDSANLYLLIHVADPTPQKNVYSGDMIWSADAAEVFVGPDQPEKDGPLLPGDSQVLLSAARPASGQAWYVGHRDTQDGVRIISIPRPDGRGYTLEAAISLRTVGLNPSTGNTLRFDLAIDDSADGSRRLRQLAWNGTERDSADRSGWGRARFVP